ncbi:M23 family metallopeptidase [Litorilinea aerophila]|uniref:M23 family metallopeptidase n=1 Tax=Litorilinea aerophila TaxID=1204385 RepID=A0A540V931_9CHLR|nr:M23 family metallopeptidase [Litorilinea aerophila]MCC9078877.1 M23 family metallopeptidase [Litorilinea aerophila]GIV80115.1 MAG: hypothetical protein KatS3mg050_4509 [Litorilinea sp.]
MCCSWRRRRNRRRFRLRRAWLPAMVAAALWAGCWLPGSRVLGAPGAAPLPQVIIVSPEDITTPTPTPPPVSATPAPTSSLVDEGQAGVYVVRPGDTLWSVALEIGVDLAEVPCAVGPHFDPAQPLVIGDMLHVPPPGFTCHTVEPGETLATVAARYALDPAQIYAVAWNGLQGQPLEAVTLVPGQHLRIPPPRSAEGAAAGFLPWILQQPINTSPFGAIAMRPPTKRLMERPAAPIPADWPYGSGYFIWPVYGWLSQGYRYDHRAVDIAAPAGTFVMAADRGVVVRAGWNDQGYGRFVVIDHNIDYVTLYAHLTEIFVQEGEIVAQGQVIGSVGSTGNSTGPHLHFEIRDFGRRINPLELLVR